MIAKLLVASFCVYLAAAEMTASPCFPPCGECQTCVTQKQACRGSRCNFVEYKPTCQRDPTCSRDACGRINCPFGYKCEAVDRQARCVPDIQMLEQRRLCFSKTEKGCCSPPSQKWRYAGGEGKLRCEKFTYTGPPKPKNVNLFDSQELCEAVCTAYGVCEPPPEPTCTGRRCPRTSKLDMPKDCNIKSIVGLNGCPQNVMDCPGIGCGRNLCGRCEICVNVFPEYCEDEDDKLCKPNGHYCMRDPVCEKWECDKIKCFNGEVCVWEKNPFGGAPVCKR